MTKKRKLLLFAAALVLVLALAVGAVAVSGMLSNGSAVVKVLDYDGVTVTFRETNKDIIDITVSSSDLTAGAQYMVMMVRSEDGENYTIDEESILYVDQAAAEEAETEGEAKVSFGVYPSGIENSVILITGGETPLKIALVEPAAEKFDIAGTTMTLGNDLALNFMVKNTDITGEGWYAEIVHGGQTTTIEQDAWVTSGDYTRISYRGIAAKQMVDEVTVTVYASNGSKLSEKTDSIRGYAMRMFGKSTAAFDTVLADMLNYGASAQSQFNYKTDDPANGQMTEEQKSKATESVEMTNIRETATGYLGTTLELESNILLNFFYSADFVGKTATVSYTDHYGVAHNYDVVIAASGTYGKVSVDKLVISDCSVKITVTVDGVSVVDSVESYCARMTDLALREPLMKFATSARTYFSK